MTSPKIPPKFRVEYGVHARPRQSETGNYRLMCTYADRAAAFEHAEALGGIVFARVVTTEWTDPTNAVERADFLNRTHR